MGGAPLSGVRILDLSRVLSGPFATMQLADLGADVWKVEPKEGDPSRDLCPPSIDGESAYYQSVNRNKRSLCIDFRHPGAGGLLLKMAEKADVVVENFLPRVKEKLGIDYEVVRARNPRIVFCSISGFGQTGPYADRPGLDNIFQGMAGLMAVTGPGSQPIKCGERVADMVAGLNAALAIVAALRARDRDGVGQFIELSLVDCLVALQAPQISNYFATGEQTPKVGNGSYFSAPTDTYETVDRPINICVMSNKHWKAMCSALGAEDWVHDPRFTNNSDRVRHRTELDELIVPLFRAKTADHWVSVLGGAGVPIGLVLDYAEVFSDPQIQQNGMGARISDGSGRTVPTIGLPVRYGRTPAELRLPPPLLGEHGRTILSEAGFSAAEIEAALEGSLLVSNGPAEAA